MSDNHKSDSERLQEACEKLARSMEAAKARQNAQIVWQRRLARINGQANNVRIVSVGQDATPSPDEEAKE